MDQNKIKSKVFGQNDIFNISFKFNKWEYESQTDRSSTVIDINFLLEIGVQFLHPCKPSTSKKESYHAERFQTNSYASSYNQETNKVTRFTN